MSNEIKVLHGTTTDCTVTELVAGIANGSGWVSNQISNTDPSDTDLVVSAKITCDSNVVSGDAVAFYLVPLDGAASGEISAGNLAPSSGDDEVTSFSVEVKQLGPPIGTQLINAASDVLYYVSAPVYCPYETFCIAAFLISDAGTIGTTGDVVRYQLSNHQYQT